MSGSYAGVAITTKVFSIIQTAIINNNNVENYLNNIFENINKEPIDNLLPYSKKIKEKIKSSWNLTGEKWRNNKKDIKKL